MLIFMDLLIDFSLNTNLISIYILYENVKKWNLCNFIRPSVYPIISVTIRFIGASSSGFDLTRFACTNSQGTDLWQ